MTRRALWPVAFFIVALSLDSYGVRSAFAEDMNAPKSIKSVTVAASDLVPTIWTFRGSTMGTTYMVKVSGTRASQAWREETTFAIDAELREVNDQMSTYLKSSELSRFNDSETTQWFDVSGATAEVVQLALEIGNQSGGGLDVSVGPLVNRWSFGPEHQYHDVPSDDEIETIMKRVGHRFLEVRLEPPALKKTIPDLRVDLSAIAKGHGVDRVVDLLTSRGAENVFVEIGGEVRVTGMKQTPSGPISWKVGIQKPDAVSNEIALAYPMQNRAMATSGDYRNFYEVDGKRYSHTIDPRTGRPVDHQLASVTVVAPTCAAADGWATALNVAGPDQAIQLANAHGLDSLLIRRVETPQEGNEAMVQFEVTGTGVLAEFAERMNQSGVLAQVTTGIEASFAERMMPVLILTAVGFGVVLLAMAVGVMFGRKSIGGSCGGLNARTDPDGVNRCSMCNTPSEGCQELRDKINQAGEA